VTRLSARPALTAALLLALAATAGGQWVEDSLWIGNYVRDFAYNYVSGYMLGVTWGRNGVFSIDCQHNDIPFAFSLHAPLHLTFNALSNRIYVTHGDGADDSVMVGNGIDGRRIREIEVAGAWRPLWDSVSNRVYVACGLENDVAVIDCATDSVIERIHTGETPVGLELSTRHRRLYVRNWDGETVSIIDLETNEVVRTIRLHGVPKVGCYHVGADKYYVGVEGGRVVAVCGSGDTVCGEVQLPVGVSVEALVVPGNELLLAGANAVSTDSVYAIDTGMDTIVGVCYLPGGPAECMVWSPATDRVYVACYGDLVAVLSADGSGVLRTLAVGDVPQVLAVAPEFGRVYVGHAGSEYVYSIRDSVTGIAEAGSPVARSPAMRAWPTPFRRRLEVELPSGVTASTVQVHSSDGRLVAELECRPGRDGLVAEWDGRGRDGTDAQEGVYIIAAGVAGTRAVCVTKVR
jgi:YVTN family beta-propeller protein